MDLLPKDVRVALGASGGLFGMSASLLSLLLSERGGEALRGRWARAREVTAMAEQLVEEVVREVAGSDGGEDPAERLRARGQRLIAARVARLYEAALDRLPDQAGLNFWIGAVQGGQPLSSLASGFLASPEFQSRFGGAGASNAAFVDQLYVNVLGRPGEDLDSDDPRARIPAWEDIVFGVRRNR